MTTLFALCRSSFIPGAGFYLSRHLSSFLHIFLHSLIQTFHPLTITFAVQRSLSIPGAGFSCPTTQPHRQPPRSHPKYPDYLSTSSNYRAHFRPTSKTTTKIDSLQADQKPIWISSALPPGTPNFTNQNEILLIEFSNQQKPFALPGSADKQILTRIIRE